MRIPFADRQQILAARDGERALVQLRHQRVLLPAQRAIAGRDFISDTKLNVTTPQWQEPAGVLISLPRLSEHRRDELTAQQIDRTQNKVW
ncbi:hypothetical protein [Bradyrhizobium liaoningense]|uniref:hypothetical protein n=1 Tax=Bradyrhizobium liaoningense TaxID=43992 RepID=UPI001BA6ECC2|nr:hypothetical protein [Bradyrhizobium liaoningense]MBR0818814.1 hypothetical protein [Bradyrhizobium liaoningense]